MGRPSNTQARQRQIVDGLRQVLAQRGYAGATIADIAAAAGLAPGLVHYHFEGKRSILLALVEDLAQRLRARAARREPPGASAAERLQAFLDAAVALGPDADAEAVACWVAICAEAVRDAEVRGVLSAQSEGLQEELTGRVRDAWRAAGRSTHGARAHAALLWAAIQGSFVVAATTPELLPRGSMAPALRRLAIHPNLPEEP